MLLQDSCLSTYQVRKSYESTYIIIYYKPWDFNIIYFFLNFQSKESIIAYYMKRDLFPFLYWNFMLKGHYHGPEFVRRIINPFANWGMCDFRWKINGESVFKYVFGKRPKVSNSVIKGGFHCLFGKPSLPKLRLILSPVQKNGIVVDFLIQKIGWTIIWVTEYLNLDLVWN